MIQILLTPRSQSVLDKNQTTPCKLLMHSHYFSYPLIDSSLYKIPYPLGLVLILPTVTVILMSV